MITAKRAAVLLLMLGCFIGTGEAAVTCNVTTVGAAFGNYDSIGNQHRDTTTTISITCSGNIGEPVGYTISLSSGSGSYLNRHLNSGSSVLIYNLYTDISRSQVWGDGTAATTTVSDSYTLNASPTTRDHTIFGRIPAGQTQVTAGAYSDNVVITLTY